MEKEKIKSEEFVESCEKSIVEQLLYLEDGYGMYKYAIQKATGIPDDLLTVILKRMKLKGIVEIIMIWDEHDCTPNGSGYKLSNPDGIR